jgi:hypothetical protein
LAILAAALVSITYAVVTAPAGGFDLNLFRDAGKLWVEGVHEIGTGPAQLYPPFAIPTFALLTLLPFDYLIIVWLLVNIVSAGLTLWLVVELYGEKWLPKLVFYFCAFVVTWAGFRTTLRLGQISFLVTALLLGALVLRRQGTPIRAGLLLGLSLCKYSLTLPFLLYFVFRREWRLAGAALAVPVVFTEIFALRMGFGFFETLHSYSRVMLARQTQGVSGWMGSTEVKVLLLSITGGNEATTFLLTAALVVAGLAAMAVVFSRTLDFGGITPRWASLRFGQPIIECTTR